MIVLADTPTVTIPLLPHPLVGVRGEGNVVHADGRDNRVRAGRRSRHRRPGSTAAPDAAAAPGSGGPKTTSAARSGATTSSPSDHSATRDTCAAGTAGADPSAGTSYVVWASRGSTTV